jgi:dephospho-CoA kinase
MLVVGLTGGIASGKTTVSRMFEEAGVPVICADELSREAVAPGSPGLEEIRRLFGDEMIDDQGGLDRPRMAQVVFQDEAKRRLLESIIHPRVEDGKNRRIKELESQGHRMVVVDVPLLYESGWDRHCDMVLVVYVSGETQMDRLVSRDGIADLDARARLDSQIPIDDKRRRADRVIDNSGSIEHTREQVKRVLEELAVPALSTHGSRPS